SETQEQRRTEGTGHDLPFSEFSCARHCREEPGDEGGLQNDWHCVTEQDHCLDRRRKRDWQRAYCQSHSRSHGQVKTLYLDQLFSHCGDTLGKRTLRARKGRLHWSYLSETRQIRIGRFGDPPLR